MTAQKTKYGVVLMNLGSPDSTAVKDVRSYLSEFLMDRRVIDYPFLMRKILVDGIIVPARAPNSAAAYRMIWTNEGSPLIVFTRRLQEALQATIPEPVEIAMRYAHPTIEAAFENLLSRIQGLEEVIAVPMYPHYAMASYETAVEQVKKVHRQNKYGFDLHFIEPYYNEQHYVHALSESMRPYLARDYDHLLFSYHGLPGRQLRKSDPTGTHCLRAKDCCNVPSGAHPTCYRHQVFETTRLVTQALGIPASKFSISFQSRLGKGWLQPFTDVRLEEMPKEGIKKLLIVCPAFVSDCLETLEEIGIRGKEAFLQAGGEMYERIPCLNTSPLWVQAIAGWINARKKDRDNEKHS